MFATQNGDYVLNVFDSLGCFGTDTLYAFNVMINEFISNGRTITVYPNPAKESIRVKGLENATSGILQIHDIAGRLVKQILIDAEEVNIQLNELETGVYLITVEYKNASYFARFVKE